MLSVWFEALVSSFPSVVVLWILSLAVMEFRTIMTVSWIAMFPVCVSMMVSNVIMLITWKVLLSMRVVMVGWLSPHWCDMGHVVKISMHVLVFIWLHLEHQVSFFNVDLLGAESGTIGIKSSVVTLVPSFSVKGVEIVLPVEVEATGLFIIIVSLNVVVEEIPWHVLGI